MAPKKKFKLSKSTLLSAKVKSSSPKKVTIVQSSSPKKVKSSTAKPSSTTLDTFVQISMRNITTSQNDYIKNYGEVVKHIFSSNITTPNDNLYDVLISNEAKITTLTGMNADQLKDLSYLGYTNIIKFL